MKSVINTLTAVLVLALSGLVAASPIPYGSGAIEARSDQTELFARAAKKGAGKVADAIVEGGLHWGKDVKDLYDITQNDSRPAAGGGKAHKAVNDIQAQRKKAEAERKANAKKLDTPTHAVQKAVQDAHAKSQADREKVERLKSGKPGPVTNAINQAKAGRHT
ncbi:hypothetical protein DFP72DRAFT_1169000 [Ephemerocybe angulata]|uniref:DUF4148 domain-containing protein n=1 Tax=Ephemerocybe angulata TaxID=980116 RepID=A0A8H6I0C3_9AGAR|nr:hypothetical protein DFP72DRAFT_1169000 [Tulosesus angulatus]